jgi:adenylate cyclase
MPSAVASTSSRTVSPFEIAQQVERILSSPEFRATPRRRDFLNYIIAEQEAGRAGGLKGYSIGVAVYGRDPSFDTRIDPLVRIEAGRLRADLEHYYLTAGKSDPLLIEIPKGANAPKYSWRDDLAQADQGIPEGDPDTQASHSRPPRRKLWPLPIRHWLVGGAIFCVIAAIGIFLTQTKPALRPAETRIASIAVLPFTVQDGDSQQDYFAQGLSQELAKNLFQFSDLLVTPPSSINLAQRSDPHLFRRSLGTTALVEGSVQRGSSSIRVLVRLIDTSTGALLWSEAYQRPLQADQILEIGDDIAGRIAATIAGNAGVLARVALKTSLAKEPNSLSAIDCVLRFYQHQIVGTLESHRRARDCLEATIRMEPQYAEAWASLSQIYGQEYRVGLNPRPGGVPAVTRAREAAERALALAPGDANAMMVRAATMFDDGDFSGFKALAEVAIKVRPGDPDLWAHYGLRIATSGDWASGAALVRRAIDMNRLHHPSWYYIPVILERYLAGDDEGALSLTKGMTRVMFMSEEFFTAMIQGRAGRLDLARQAGDRVNRESPRVAEQFWSVFRAWKMSDATQERLAEGLRKAGVAIDRSAMAPR